MKKEIFKKLVLEKEKSLILAKKEKPKNISTEYQQYLTFCKEKGICPKDMD